jgi:hypothetical protein
VSRFTPRGASEWGAVLPAWIGMLGLIACFVVWAVTRSHIVEPLFVTTFGGLLAVGAGAKALDTLRQPPTPPIPPGDPPSDIGQP